MSLEPDAVKDEEERTAERQAASMKVQLDKEVASWSKGRREHSGESLAAPSSPVVQRRAPRLAVESKKASAPPVAAKAAGAASKPFSMSYAGMTQAEYTQYLRDRGSR